MNLILLSGASKRNKVWIEQVVAEFKTLYKKTYIQNYQHWNNESSDFDLDIELKYLEKAAKNLEPYDIFAKSAGSILACAAMAKGFLKPNKCLLAGIPLEMVQNYSLPLDKWLLFVKCNTAVLQNEHDPLGSFLDVSKYIKQVNNKRISIKELLGNTHDYNDIAELKNNLFNIS